MNESFTIKEDIQYIKRKIEDFDDYSSRTSSKWKLKLLVIGSIYLLAVIIESFSWINRAYNSKNSNVLRSLFVVHCCFLFIWFGLSRLFVVNLKYLWYTCYFVILCRIPYATEEPKAFADIYKKLNKHRYNPNYKNTKILNLLY